MLKRLRDGYCYDLKVDLGGSYQYKNVRTAAAVTDFLHELSPLTISRRAFVEGVASVAAMTSLAGRWQVLDHTPMVVCDTGHNAHGISLVVEDLRRMRKDDARLICVVGFSADKDLNAILAVLPREAYYIFTQAESHRAALAEDVKQRAVAVGLNGEVIANVKEALAKARAMASSEDVIFVGGSNYVVAEIL
jgi:dihydrofolate synthase/folylpolyglutamate synthase